MSKKDILFFNKEKIKNNQEMFLRVVIDNNHSSYKIKSVYKEFIFPFNKDELLTNKFNKLKLKH